MSAPESNRSKLLYRPLRDRDPQRVSVSTQLPPPPFSLPARWWKPRVPAQQLLLVVKCKNKEGLDWNLQTGMHTGARMRELPMRELTRRESPIL